MLLLSWTGSVSKGVITLLFILFHAFPLDLKVTLMSSSTVQYCRFVSCKAAFSFPSHLRGVKEVEILERRNRSKHKTFLAFTWSYWLFFYFYLYFVVKH